MSDPNYNIQYQNGKNNLCLTPSSYDSSTSLDLFGKSATDFGSGFWSNIVHLLENFYSENEPRNAIKGQLWYSGTELKLCTEPSTTTLTNEQYNLLVSSNVKYVSDATWATINTTDSVNASAFPGVDEFVRRKYVDNRSSVTSVEPDTTNLSAGAIWYDDNTGACKILVDNGTKFWDPLNTIYVANKAFAHASLGQLYFNTSPASYGLNICTGFDARSNNPIWTNATATSLTPTITPIIGTTPSALMNNQLYVDNNTLTFNMQGRGVKLAGLVNGTLQVTEPVNDNDVATKKFVLSNVPVKLNAPSSTAQSGELFYMQPAGYTANGVFLKTDDGLVSLLSATNVLSLPINSSVPATTAAGSLCFTANDSSLNLFAYGKWNTIPTNQNTNNFTGVNRFTQPVTVNTTDAPFNVSSTKLVPNLNVGYINDVQITGVATTGSVLTALDDHTATWSAPQIQPVFDNGKKVLELNNTNAGVYTCINVAASVTIKDDIAIGKKTTIYNSKSTDISITGPSLTARLIGYVKSVKLLSYGVCEITCINTGVFLITGDIRA
jgi:hypothetical protein